MKNNPQKIIDHVLNFLMIALGIIGIVGGFYYSFEFPKIALIGISLLIVIGWLSYYTYIYSHHQLRRTWLIFISFLLLCVYVINIEQTKFLLAELKKVIVHDYYLSVQTLFAPNTNLSTLLPVAVLMTIGAPTVLLVVSFICRKEKSGLKLVILLILYFLPAFILHPLKNYTSYCFIAFFMYGFLFYCILKYQTHQIYFRLFYTIGLVIILCLSSFFLEKNPIFNQHSTTVLTNIIHWMDHNRFVNGANIMGTSYEVDGSLPTGSISTNSQVALTIEAEKPFSSYLRSYSLAHYDNNQWDNDSVETQLINSLMIYVDFLFKDIGIGVENEIDVTINSPSTDYQIVPYYTKMTEEFVDDSYYKKVHTHLKVIENWDKYSPLSQYTYYSETYSYSSYVYEHYMDVPKELDKKLNAFLKAKFQEKYGYDMVDAFLTYEEWADFVKGILQEETSYTLNAGNLPRDNDFVEYFLFENKKGSCTHYATTGALMLRSVGIPTRFVKGFVLKESDFVNKKAEVKNNRSHAWIEIYIDGLGWIPYEMTPSDANTINSVGDMLDDNLTSPATTQIPTASQQPQQAQQNTTTTVSQKPKDNNDFFNNCLDFILKYQSILIGVCVVGMTMIVYRLLTKKWFFVRVKKYNQNQQMIKYYLRLKKISRFGGIIDKNITQLAYKAKFSQHQMTEEESLQMQSYYQIFVKDTYQSLVWYKKLIYKYIFGYI